MKKEKQIELIVSLVRAIESNTQELWSNDLSQTDTAIQLQHIAEELEALKKIPAVQLLLNQNKK